MLAEIRKVAGRPWARARKWRPLHVVASASAAALLAATLTGLALQAGPAAAAMTATAHDSRVPIPTAKFLPGTPVLNEAGWGPSVVNLSSLGYTQQEFTIAGTATSYTSATPLTSDGKWTVTPATTAKYETRIIVRRPANPADFNGTVVVDWLNVSNGYDWDPEWAQMHEELIRGGFAWVGVSAQSAGIQDLITNHASRYGDLIAPGDSYSYDIFSQAGALVKYAGNSGAKVMGDLRVKNVIGIGHSQSAFRLRTYINAVAPIANVFDGYFVHGGGLGAPLSQAPQATINTPTPDFIRSDLNVPVMDVQSETEVVGFGAYLNTQPDTSKFRLWEEAGTAHVDQYEAGPLVDNEPQDCGQGGPNGVNTGDAHYVDNAAIWAMHLWVTYGRPPAEESEPLVLTNATPPALAVDANGNAYGGVPEPDMQVPTARLYGAGSGDCFFWGGTVPFSPATLASLYPTHLDYVTAVVNACEKDVAGGFLLPADATQIEDTAMASTIGD
jgi:Alpha/beta hydrolase domain